MAIRTNAAAVKLLLAPGGDYDIETNPDINPSIETASSFVDEVAVNAVAKSIPITDARLELMERWLAAHAYKQSDKTLAAKTTDGASATYDGKTDKGFQSTLYGQMALRLDPTGTLALIDATDSAAFECEAHYAGGLPTDEPADID